MSIPAVPAARAGGAVDPNRSGLPRGVLLLVATAAAVLLGVGIKGAADIVAPSMLALVLTIAVLPVGSWARGRGWPGWLATLLALIAVYLILIVLVVGSAFCIAKLVLVLPQYTDSANDLRDSVEKSLQDRGVSSSSTTAALSKLDPSKITSFLTSLLSGILGALGSLFFIVTLLFFFVVAVPGFAPRMQALARIKPEVASSLGHFVSGTQRYLVMTALFGAIVAVLDVGALWLLAIPLPLVWGFFSFLTNFIPNIGFVLGIIPPALLGLLDSGWQKAVVVVLVYSLINVTIQTFIQPRYVGATVGLSAEMTFMSLVVWTFLLGALGALLAVPMTLLFRAIFIDPDVRAAWVLPLIETKVEPEPPEPEPDPEPAAPAASSKA